MFRKENTFGGLSAGRLGWNLTGIVHCGGVVLCECPTNDFVWVPETLMRSGLSQSDQSVSPTLSLIIKLIAA